MKNLKIVLLLASSLLITSLLSAQCLSDGHSTNPKDSWLSCQPSNIPNGAETTDYHWIYYDLGYSYPLEMVKIWNYNVANETRNGIKDGEIFYSVDGQNWISGGVFQVPEASGESDYTGWEGIDLNSVLARFITIAAYSNWGNSNCTGFSEVRFNIGEQITSTKEERLSNTEVLVFPNPTNHTLSINMKNNQSIQQLIIVNNAGHEIIRQNNLSTNFTIDLTAFPPAMYYLKVWTTDQTYLVNKFVKTDL